MIVEGPDEQNIACAGINEGGGIAAGVLAITPYDFELAPGFAIVFRCFHDQVNLPMIEETISSFAESQQSTTTPDDGRDAIHFVAIGMVFENVMACVCLCKALLPAEQEYSDKDKIS